MEGDRTTGEAIDLFLRSEAAREFIRPGAEQTFGVALAEFIAQVDLDRWEGSLDYLDDAIETFVGESIDDWSVYHPREVEEEWRQPFWSSFREVIDAGLDARYSAEVSSGLREELRASVEEAVRGDVEDAPERSPLASLTAQVQAFVQAVKEFVRGRELEEPTQEHGAER